MDTVGVNFTWTFNVFLINIELWVHELVIIETDIIFCFGYASGWQYTLVLAWFN